LSHELITIHFMTYRADSRLHGVEYFQNNSQLLGWSINSSHFIPNYFVYSPQNFCLIFHKVLLSFRWEVFILLPNPQAGRPSFVSCPCLSIHYMAVTLRLRSVSSICDLRVGITVLVEHPLKLLWFVYVVLMFYDCRFEVIIPSQRKMRFLNNLFVYWWQITNITTVSVT